MAFQVQSIPAVFIMKDGAVMDGFVGAKPDHAIKEIVEALIPLGEAVLQPVVEVALEPEPFVINDDFDNELAGLLPHVKTDEVAKSRYLEILDIMGTEDPRTVGYRRKLTAQLF
jgi:putative thioredoxin